MLTCYLVITLDHKRKWSPMQQQMMMDLFQVAHVARKYNEEFRSKKIFFRGRTEDLFISFLFVCCWERLKERFWKDFSNKLRFNFFLSLFHSDYYLLSFLFLILLHHLHHSYEFLYYIIFLFHEIFFLTLSHHLSYSLSFVLLPPFWAFKSDWDEEQWMTTTKMMMMQLWLSNKLLLLFFPPFLLVYGKDHAMQVDHILKLKKKKISLLIKPFVSLFLIHIWITRLLELPHSTAKNSFPLFWTFLLWASHKNDFFVHLFDSH